MAADDQLNQVDGWGGGQLKIKKSSRRVAGDGQVAADVAASKIVAAMVGGAGGSRRGGEAARDCIYTMCRWRDQVAREEDEGNIPPSTVRAAHTHTHARARARAYTYTRERVPVRRHTHHLVPVLLFNISGMPSPKGARLCLFGTCLKWFRVCWYFSP